MKLIYQNYNNERKFKVSQNDYFNEIPEDFLEIYQKDMDEYLNKEVEIYQEIKNQKKRLSKLRYNFENHIKENHPEYFL